MREIKKLKWLFSLIIAILLLGVGAGSAFAAEKNQYTIGTDVTFAPFEFSNAEGKYVGIDMEILEEVAKENHLTLDIKPVGFSPAVQAVEAGQMDGMIAGMTITDERKESFDFSDPYFQSGLQLGVSSKNKDIQSYNDLKGKTVAAKTGTESAEYLEKNKAKYGYKIKLYDAADVMYSVLDSGNVDAVVDDYPVIGYAVKQGKPIRLVGEYIKGGSYGFAVKKGTNPELLSMFNETLAHMKESGQYQKLLDKYIGNSKDEAASEKTLMGILHNNYQSLLKGLGWTLFITFVSFAIAMILGLLIGLMNVSQSKFAHYIAIVFIDVIRGIPLFVLALFIYLGIPNLLDVKLNAVVAGIITLSLNATAYIAEIVRGGIEAVPTGQYEASRSLGLSHKKTMQKVIVPQAIKLMIPSLINQFVITLKDTTILSAVGILELLKVGQIIMARNLQSFRVLLIIAVMYLIVITALTKLSNLVEKKVKASG